MCHEFTIAIIVPSAEKQHRLAPPLPPSNFFTVFFSLIETSSIEPSSISAIISLSGEKVTKVGIHFNGKVKRVAPKFVGITYTLFGSCNPTAIISLFGEKAAHRMYE